MAQDDAELAGQASAARAGAGAHRVERTMLVELEHVPIGGHIHSPASGR